MDPVIRKFRGALGGFNRRDVLQYIEQSSAAHQRQVEKLERRLAQAEEERSILDQELAGLRDEKGSVAAEEARVRASLEESTRTLARLRGELTQTETQLKVAKAELQRLQAQVGELAGLLHRLGVTEPRIALNHCAETVSEKFPHTVGYAAIIRQAAEGRWGRLRVDGPLDLRTSLDPQCLATKGIVSVLEGRADALVLPDIETGNLLYKALPLFAAAKVAGVLCGTLKPVVLPSRGDDAEAKYHSLLLAVFNA